MTKTIKDAKKIIKELQILKSVYVNALSYLEFKTEEDKLRFARSVGKICHLIDAYIFTPIYEKYPSLRPKNWIDDEANDRYKSTDDE